MRFREASAGERFERTVRGSTEGPVQFDGAALVDEQVVRGGIDRERRHTAAELDDFVSGFELGRAFVARNQVDALTGVDGEPGMGTALAVEAARGHGATAVVELVDVRVFLVHPEIAGRIDGDAQQSRERRPRGFGELGDVCASGAELVDDVVADILHVDVPGGGIQGIGRVVHRDRFGGGEPAARSRGACRHGAVRFKAAAAVKLALVGTARAKALDAVAALVDHVHVPRPFDRPGRGVRRDSRGFAELSVSARVRGAGCAKDDARDVALGGASGDARE